MAEARIDQWLWAVRIFKSRTKANDACKKGKVEINGDKVKPSATVAVNDHIKVGKNRFLYEFIIQKVIKKRVGAPAAQECYKDVTPEEELKKFDRWYVGKKQGEFREKGAGRPTKKERRAIEDFKSKGEK